MKLDNRLTGFPFTCFNTKLAEHHIGKKDILQITLMIIQIF